MVVGSSIRFNWVPILFGNMNNMSSGSELNIEYLLRVVLSSGLKDTVWIWLTSDC